ncbi:hypothetical protein O4H52_03095 [Sphingomonadaceae bacterium G21617-S1]|nr:hypothetical protein [Sphingomonadaceae bacterium G21617-S1]
MSIWDTASAAIDAGFAVPGGILFSGRGINLAEPIVAIREDDVRSTFDGDTPIPIVGFEIAMGLLPRRPIKGDTLREITANALWRVKDVSDRPAVRKWFCVVEAVG